MFAPDHPLRPTVTALAVGNVGKRRDATNSHPLPLGEGQGEGAPNPAKPRSHDTSRIAWAKLMARVGEEVPLLGPACGGDDRPGTHPSATSLRPHATHRSDNGCERAIDRAILPPLLDQATDLVREGRTSPSEVTRVLGSATRM